MTKSEYHNINSIVERIFDIRYCCNGASAKTYMKYNEIELWLHLYLNFDANAENISSELEQLNPIYFGPIQMPIYLFDRCCGPEDSMRYHEDENLFRRKIRHLVEEIKKGADFPPLLLRYENHILDMYDGAHRYEAYKEVGKEQVDVIVLFKDFQNQHDFLNKYADVISINDWCE